QHTLVISTEPTTRFTARTGRKPQLSPPFTPLNGGGQGNDLAATLSSQPPPTPNWLYPPAILGVFLYTFERQSLPTPLCPWTIVWITVINFYHTLFLLITNP